ncbi:cytotoxic and regulatory T-cell molecule isoform X2 [Eleginops maclovinus]|uniref:cytotoxic and regulatory T-cell molecule isoform X2 n=1 Tax=Eleginops maclovinus TaxID=56733 RepID=UPI00307FDD56
MEVKLQLCVFLLLVQVSLAVWKHVTVLEGHTLILSCPVIDAHNTKMEWRNPEGHIIFFNHRKASGDKRYSLNTLCKSEYTISISKVTFNDGGKYTCAQYGDHTTETEVEVTVLGFPKVKKVKHEGRYILQCTAQGNHSPPNISWELDGGPEIRVYPQLQHEDKKYVSMQMLFVGPVKDQVTVKCIVRHPALYSRTLMHFVKIGRKARKYQHTTTTRSPTARPPGSTEAQRTTRYITTTDLKGPSSEGPKLPTDPSTQTVTSAGNPASSTHSHLSDYTTTLVLSDSTRRRNDTSSNATSTAGWTSVSETTEEISSFNHTEGNDTGIFNDLKMRTGTERSSLLVFLVTCLIFGLLIVVIFFVIKLRRAHIAWKRENEDSDPSEESNKSKSSQEEKNSQGQRRRGFFNTAFTQYVVEKPTVITSVTNTAAMAAAGAEYKEKTSQHPTPGQTLTNQDIKETEL